MTAYTFFCILQLINKENQTELEKSIPHIPSCDHDGVIAQVLSVHLMNIERCQTSADPQTKPTIHTHPCGIWVFIVAFHKGRQ